MSKIPSIECSNIDPNSWLGCKLGQNDCKHFRTVHVGGDGDCLHSSLRVICAVSGNAQYTTHDFRYIVANQVLNTNDIQMTKILETWLDIYTSALQCHNLELARDYAQMDGVRTLNENGRKRIFQNMMDKNIFWGEEHTLRVIEDKLGIRIIVFKPDIEGVSFVHRDLDKIDPTLPPITHLVMLSLFNRHYEPIGFIYNGKLKFALKVNEIPTVIQDLCKSS